MMAYVNLAIGLYCTFMTVTEFARLKDTRQWILFWNTFFAGANLYIASVSFGWL